MDDPKPEASPEIQEHCEPCRYPLYARRRQRLLLKRRQIRRRHR